MRQAVADMEQHKQLKRIKIEVDPNLEKASLSRAQTGAQDRPHHRRDGESPPFQGSGQLQF